MITGSRLLRSKNAINMLNRRKCFWLVNNLAMPAPNKVQVHVDEKATIAKTINNAVTSASTLSAVEVYAVTELMITVIPFGLMS